MKSSKKRPDNMKEVVVYLSDGYLSCISVPSHHSPVVLIETTTGEVVYAEEGHTEDIPRFFNDFVKGRRG